MCTRHYTNRCVHLYLNRLLLLLLFFSSEEFVFAESSVQIWIKLKIHSTQMKPYDCLAGACQWQWKQWNEIHARKWCVFVISVRRKQMPPQMSYKHTTDSVEVRGGGEWESKRECVREREIESNTRSSSTTVSSYMRAQFYRCCVRQHEWI